jgi:hypothetical protein
MIHPYVRASDASLFLCCAFACGGATNSSRTTQDARDSSSVDEVDERIDGAEGEADDLDAMAVGMPTANVAGGAGLVAEATRALDTMTASTYSHNTQVEGTVYDVDCSGFLDYLLRRVDPNAFRELSTLTVRRPLANHFVDFLAAPTPRARWLRVARVQDLTPGDILAWKRPADVFSMNTGHVMLVASPPEQRDVDAWVVAVIDSTAASHGPRDARKIVHRTGIGRGVVVLDTDTSGTPLRYHWTDVRTSPGHVTEIAMGRLRP